jgi:chromosome segregation ATPase
MQEELEAFRKHVLLELQDVQQKIAESSERATDTRRQLGETEGRLGLRADSVWEETRQQWEAVSKRLQEESRAVQEQLSVQRRVEQEHRDELDGAIRAEASARAAATAAAASELEAAVLALGKRIEGVGGVEAHLAEARAAANEAIAELRQQLADEEARRVEHGGSLEARLVTADEALRQAEERIRGLVAGKDDEAKLREDALLSALQRVKGGVEELGRRAEGMESAQRRHAEELVARHTEMTKALNAGARHTIAIADAHRRDIDRVCRESECGTVLLALVERVAAAESEERRDAEAVRAAQALEHGLKALKAEVVSALVPRAVKEEVKEEMALRVLPLQYSVTDLTQAVHDNETQAQNFHDSVSIKLEMMEGSVDSHTEELQKYATSEKAAAAELKRLDALILAQQAAHSRRLDHAETNVAEATAAAVLESMVRELEAGRELTSQLAAASLAATVAQLEDRVKEVGDKVMDVGDKLASMSTSTREQLRQLQTKLAETEQLTTDLGEMVSDESTDKDVEVLKSQVAELVEKVKRVEGELDAVLVAGGGGGVSPMASGSQDSALIHLSTASAKDSARQERKMLGGGDMDSISEEEEPPSPAPVAPVAPTGVGATGAAPDTRTVKDGGGSGNRKEEGNDVEDAAGDGAEQDAAMHSPPPDAKIDSAPPSQAVESDKGDGGKAGGVEGGGLASAPQPLAADKDASLNT